MRDQFRVVQSGQVSTAGPKPQYDRCRPLSTCVADIGGETTSANKDARCTLGLELLDIYCTLP